MASEAPSLTRAACLAGTAARLPANTTLMQAMPLLLSASCRPSASARDSLPRRGSAAWIPAWSPCANDPEDLDAGPLPEHDGLDFTGELPFPGPFLPAEDPIPDGFSPQHHEAGLDPVHHEGRDGSLSQARSITEPLSCAASEQLAGSYGAHVSSTLRSRHGRARDCLAGCKSVKVAAVVEAVWACAEHAACCDMQPVSGLLAPPHQMPLHYETKCSGVLCISAAASSSCSVSSRCKQDLCTCPHASEILPAGSPTAWRRVIRG